MVHKQSHWTMHCDGWIGDKVSICAATVASVVLEDNFGSSLGDGMMSSSVSNARPTPAVAGGGLIEDRSQIESCWL